MDRSGLQRVAEARFRASLGWRVERTVAGGDAGCVGFDHAGSASGRGAECVKSKQNKGLVELRDGFRGRDAQGVPERAFQVLDLVSVTLFSFGGGAASRMVQCAAAKRASHGYFVCRRVAQ